MSLFPTAAKLARPRLPILFGLLASLYSSVVAAETAPAVWGERYARAKAALAEGRSADAERELEALAADAPTKEQERLARELLDVAREAARRERVSPDIRTTDELSVLYTSAFVYGLGTSAWVVLQIRPENLAGAVLPFAALTASAVGGVAVADDYRPFRRGVPHSIAAGLYLGFGQGVWVVGYQHAGAVRRDDGTRWGSETVSTVLWTGATLGGVTGGLVGAWREPTPGRVSFTASAGTWAGLVGGFAAASLQKHDRRRGETSFATGGVTYNLGVLSGLAFAPLIAPSVARVRFVDLGAVGGGLLGAGAYAIALESRASTRGGLGSAALGIAAGIGVTWWLTEDMPTDPPAGAPKASVRPLLTPTDGGWLVGLHGEL